MKKNIHTVFIDMKSIVGCFAVAVLFTSCKWKVSKTEIVTNTRPNIVLILSDDMGYSDIGAYGGEIDTPHLDGLAKNGVLFTQFYNSARCCPTRASLMTGLYPHQSGIGHMTNVPGNPKSHDLGVSAYRGFLNRNNVTLGELLKMNGYKTYMSGKWHLGMDKMDQWPLQRGFDKFYGVLAGASNYFKPEGKRGITVGNKQIEVTDDDYYTTDAFTHNAIKFIDESQQSENKDPFFLYLAYTAPHWPLQAPQNKIDKYLNRYDKGWDAIRESRYAQMQELGIIDKQWNLSPRDAVAWGKLSDKKKKELSLRRAIYAAQVDQMDENIGRLITHLKEKNILDNTIVIFLNDNGACAEGGMLGGGNTEYLQTKKGHFLTYGQAWANSSNTPYRKYKHWVHEGGIATPMIVHWPNKIGQNMTGKIIKQYGFLPDIMSTLADVSNAIYPTEYKGNKIPPMVGKSLLPLLEGNNNPIHTLPIFWEHEGNKAVRLGKYKLVMEWKGVDENKWELYNIEEDRSELNDLSVEMTGKVIEMSKMWGNWAAKNEVLPWNEVERMIREKNKQH